MRAPGFSGSSHPLTGVSVTSTTPSSVSTSIAAVVSWGSCTEWLTEREASTALPCTWTEVTEPDVDTGHHDVGPLGDARCVGEARVDRVARREQAAVEEEDGADAAGHDDDRDQAEHLGVPLGEGLHGDAPRPWRPTACRRRRPADGLEVLAQARRRQRRGARGRPTGTRVSGSASRVS